MAYQASETLRDGWTLTVDPFGLYAFVTLTHPGLPAASACFDADQMRGLRELLEIHYPAAHSTE